MPIAAVDVTIVIVAAINGVVAIVTALIAYSVRRDIRTPSGESIGKITERTHHLTETNSAQLIQHGQTLRKLDGGSEE